jgi:hypothetical protein
MARRIAYAEWTGEPASGRGEVSTVDVEPVGADAGAGSSPTELRPTPRGAERWGAGRERRALEGRVISGIRAQSRRRRSSSARRSPALAPAKKCPVEAITVVDSETGMQMTP